MAFTYDSTLPLHEARRQYFERSGFALDGGYSARWVKLKIGPAVVAFPNTKGRVRAVKLHDVHHVLTEYATNWTGEGEIAAWEIASGCGRYLAAWLLNFGAFAIGLLLAPSRMFRAFVRGRVSGNLYRGEFEERLLARTVGDVREELCIPRSSVEARPIDRAAFIFWAALSVLVSVSPYVAGIVLFALLRAAFK